MLTSLYIHIPWCVRKCPYCDFNSHQKKADLPEQDYVDCLIRDLQTDLQQYNVEQPLRSIFIGGGTPSLFSAHALDRILQAVDQHWGIPSGTEITMEANPGTVARRHFKGYKSAGVNRLSLGVQSFNTEHLKLLGRIHNADEALQAVSIARQAGFDNLNIDLMFGLPKQFIEQGLADLQQAIELQAEHLSWYQLTLEPNTVFYKKPPKLPNEDLIADLQDQGQALLAAHGFAQYEISAYSQADKQCQHNLNYWQFGDYVGIGAGAHGKLSTEQTIIRTRKQKQPESYLQADTLLAEQTIVTADMLGFEYMLNALRLNKSINVDDFERSTNLSLEAIDAPLKMAVEEELLTIDGKSIKKTQLGQRYLNNLLELFL